MRNYFLLFFIITSSAFFAQFSAVSLNEKSINTVSAKSKNALLYVVIDNEKDPCDAALVNAVKNYWKIGSFKYISKAEYLEQSKKDALILNTFYLCESYESYSNNTESTLEITNRLKKIHTGVYNLNFVISKEENKKEKVKTTTKTESIGLNFDLRPSTTTNKEKVIEGYFDLMIKYFNNEILFCQNFKSIKDVKKEDKDGIVYFNEGMADVQSRDILLTKEQVTKIEPKDKKDKKVTAADAVAQFNGPKNVFTVYPEDIKMASTKGDKQVLIYTNDMLISANNGAVIAATNIYAESKQKFDGFILIALGILGASFGAATLIK